MTVPLPPAGDTSWNDWAQYVHRQVSDAVSVLAYGALGNGVADDTAAIQAALNAAPAGGGVIFPAGYTFRLTAGLTVNTRLLLTGGGLLSWTAGLDADGYPTGITLSADGCAVRGLTLDNPSQMTGSPTFEAGGTNTGIAIRGNDVSVIDCTIDSFQNGIVVTRDGEFQGFRIIGNRVRDILGTGGAGQIGEDRGDGISTWGSLGVISGNVVNAKAGTDARIGIHVEGLPLDHPASPAHSDQMVVISGNTVTGKFRRSIAIEEANNCVITGNAIADATWWSIALINTAGCAVTGNTIIWSRTAADTQGSSYSPRRVPLMAWGRVVDSVFSGNVIRATATSAADAFLATESTDTLIPVDVLFVSNTCAVDSGAAIGDGLLTGPVSTRVRATGNKFTGFINRGCYLFGSDGFEIRGNIFDTGLTTPVAGTVGVGASEVTATAGIIDGNTIRGVFTGIQLYSNSGSLVTGNVVQNANDGLNGFGCSNTLVANNSFTVTGADLLNIANGSGGNVVVNNM